jgi:chromosome partitioning protein
MAKTYAIVSQKGGAGKTTSTLNLAAAFALRQLRTLVIDLDPQGGAAFGLGLRPGRDFDKGVYSLLKGQASIRDVVLQTDNPYLRFVPTGVFDSVSSIDRFQNIAKRLSTLRNAVMELREHCDVILFDTPPGENSLTVSAMSCADSVVIPLQCEPLALRTLPQILRLVREVKTKVNPALDIEGVLLTMYDVRYGFTEQVTEQVWNNFPRELVFETIIPRREDFSKAFIQGLPSVFEDPMSPASLSYVALADEMIQRIARDAGLA